ncbi:MAG: hypothetical protein U0176_15765 [Bacteroidia bacterium]
MKPSEGLGSVNAIEIKGDSIAYVATNEGFCRLAITKKGVKRSFFNGYLWGKSKVFDLVSIGTRVFAGTEQGLLTFDDSLFHQGISKPKPMIEWPL